MGQLTSTPLDSLSSAKMIASLLPVTPHKAKKPIAHGTFITPFVSVGQSVPACMLFFFSLCEKDRLRAEPKT